MNLEKIRIATRKSPLAMAQTHQFIAHLKAVGVTTPCEIIEMETTGDKQLNWSLPKEGGKGLFTKELEHALITDQADVAIHSAKDMPTDIEAPLVLAGYLPRADVRDALILSKKVETPKTLPPAAHAAAHKPKRCTRLHFGAKFRGNVQTRLNKVASGICDATFLAMAGLKRLEIHEFEGVEIRPIEISEMVPAVGQAAITVQCKAENAAFWQQYLHADTYFAVELERAFLSALGGGCHSAFAAHYENGTLHTYHEDYGRNTLKIETNDLSEAKALIQPFIDSLA